MSTVTTSDTQITVPMADEAEGYAARHINLNLKTTHAATFKRLFVGLQESGARLADGHYVNSTSDVVRYLLDQLVAE